MMDISAIKKQKEYSTELEKLLNNELKEDDFKKLRGFMGVYAHKDGQSFMVRPRISSGVITFEQIKSLIRLSRKYSGSKLHITSRQDVQFHDLTLINTKELLEELLESGFISIGAGGDGVRNVALSPYSGILKGEAFDVTEHALYSNQIGVDLNISGNLPRKFKISFSSSHEDHGNAKIADLGFIAKVINDERGFEVYVGGGFGSNSSYGMKFSDYIPESDFPKYIAALYKLFSDHGDRTNRSKARIRHIRQRIGDDQFLELVNKYLSIVEEEGYKKFERKTDYKLIEVIEGETIEFTDARVIAENVAGNYSIYVHPFDDFITADELQAIVTTAESLDESIELRITNTQGILVRRVKGQYVNKILRVIEGIGVSELVKQSLTCIGAPKCRIGNLNPENTLKHIVSVLDSEDKQLKNLIPKINISGCSNSCGLHYLTTFGFSGKPVKLDNRLVPSYNFYIGLDKTFEPIGVIPSKLIGYFVLEIAEELKISGYNLEELVVNRKDYILDIFEKFKVENIDLSRVEDLYYEPFSDIEYKI